MSRQEYFEELTLNLQHEGFTVQPETEEGLLPVEWGGRRLCLALENGGVRYRKEDAAKEARSEALDKVVGTASTTAEYMSQMEAAPQLTANGLTGDYRLLADFNDVVLAGHPTQYGVQFITWDRVPDRNGLNAGDYYGPSRSVDSYTSAKRGFATRSGLIPRSALFTPEQLTEVYRSIHETLENNYPLTDERREHLESAAKQIERGVPDLEARVELSSQKELKLAAAESPEDDRIFCQERGRFPEKGQRLFSFCPFSGIANNNEEDREKMKAHFTNRTKRAGQGRKPTAPAETSMARAGLRQKRRQKKLPCNRPVRPQEEIRRDSV